MLQFTGERLVPGAENCEPSFAAKMYHEHAARYLFGAQIVERRRVLDIGCGVGYGTALLADAGAAEIVAFDVSPEAIDHARLHYARPSISYEVASADEFEFGQFDVITCFELLEHVADQERVLANIARSLAANGLALISTPRPHGSEPQSVFHIHELGFDEFHELIEKYFGHSIYWFEANQYGSRIDTESASDEARVVSLERSQFDPQHADYFVVAAGNDELRADRFRPVHVLGDASYVLTLERDVEVLRDAERSLKETLTSTEEDYETEVRALRRDLARSERALARAEERHDRAVQHTRAMTQTISWRFTRPLRAVRGTASNAARLQQRAREIRRTRGARELLAAISRRLQRQLHERRAGSVEPLSEIELSDAKALRASRSTETDVVFLIGCWDGQSKRYRVSNIAAGLRELGHSALILDDADAALIVENDIKPRRLVVFRAPLHDRGGVHLDVFRHVRANGGLVVVDFDDLVFEPSIVDQIDGFRLLPDESRIEYLEGVAGYRRMLDEADLVTCPTAFLAGRVTALDMPAAVVRNSVDRAQLDLAETLLREERPESESVRIGYLSGSKTHQADFAEAASAVERVLDERPETSFTLVGYLDLPPSWSRFGDRVSHVQFMPYLDLLRHTRQIDINIAPLVVGNDFCEAKSELKIFEAAVVGIPTVASATASYARAIDEGIDGFVADSADSWYAKLDALASSRDLRISMGAAARERAIREYTYQSAAAEFASAVALERPKPQVVVEASPNVRVSWIVPGLIVGGGGHRNILRAAYHLERLGYDVQLYFTEWDGTDEELNRMIRAHFYPLRGTACRYRGDIAACDVLFATHWSTVRPALDNRSSAREVMYFVQDFEPFFYPMGTEYLLAENTYREGLYHVTSGPWCERVLRTKFAAEADHFQFPIDTTIYVRRERTDQRTRVLYFAKPEMPRRCYSLGVEALRQFHRLRPDVEIVFFGSPAVDVGGLGFPVRLAGILDLEELAELYSNSDLGVVFSPTNPSLVPYEMMSCGLPVVDLSGEFAELNYGGRTDMALLVDPDPPLIAAQMADLLADRIELRERSRRGEEFAATFPTEEQMGARISELIKRRLSSSRAVEALTG
jgi:glycosyltransferase involved in cell wall biosynthesis/SAM-dependent methyltransferase